MQNPGAYGGALLFGTRGAIKGYKNKGRDGGLKGALIGGAQGAAGGAIIGGVGQKATQAVIGKDGQPGIFTQASEAKKKLNETIKSRLGDQADTGLFSTFKNRRALANLDAEPIGKIKQNIQNIKDQVSLGHLDSKKARGLIDAESAKHVLTQNSKLRNQLIFGTAGVASAGLTGAKLIRQSSQAGGGQESEDQARANLARKYQETGKLDPAQMQFLIKGL